MDNIDVITVNAINRYYTTLDNVGYTCPKDTGKLLLLVWLNTFLADYSGYIDANLYYKINDILECLEGCCLIPYTRYTKSLPSSAIPIKGHQRQIVQGTSIRATEVLKPRVTEG